MSKGGSLVGHDAVRTTSPGRVLLTLVIAAVAALTLAPGASGAQFQRPLEGVFGTSEQPTFEWPTLVATDPSTGDVLVADFRTSAISRFDEDGTPAPFAELGGSVLDGKLGPGGRPCAEEPASCDKTPQNGLEVASEGGRTQQLTVDPSNGDLYITQAADNLVDIFSSEGRYLGQLTAAGTKPLASPHSVAIGADGTVYVGASITAKPSIATFVPSSAVPVNTDNTEIYPIEAEVLAGIAVGSGPSAGSIYVASAVGKGANTPPDTYKLALDTGAVEVFAEGYDEVIMVDPSTGNPIIRSLENRMEGFEFDGAGSSAAAPLSRLVAQGAGQILDMAGAATGDVYVVKGILEPHVFVYGPPAIVPTTTIGTATDVTGTTATLAGNVTPEGIAVTACDFEYGLMVAGQPSWEHTVPCEGGASPPGAEEFGVQASISGLTSSGTEYVFRLAVSNENGTERSSVETFTTAGPATTEAANQIARTSATLRGVVRPEGQPTETCTFEWGLDSSASFEHNIACSPNAAVIPVDSGAHPVTAAIGGLQSGVRYRVRLATTQSGTTHFGKTRTFRTLGPPQVSDIRALDADQTSVTIEANITPDSFATSYHFDWGVSSGYGHSTPGHFESIGEGTQPVRVSARLSGLAPGTTYHYRVVATSPAGTTITEDQQAETLDSCGLPEGRCFEMASPREPGPVAAPGRKVFSHNEMVFQAGTQSGALAYSVEAGLAESTRGSEVLYLGKRAGESWSYEQISPGINTVNEKRQASLNPSMVLGMSPSLGCGIVASSQPLTGEPAEDLVRESGGGNLYRRSSSGSYTLITDIPPENPQIAGENGANTFLEYSLVGFSDDCNRVFFFSTLHYPGVGGVGTKRLYEWDEGELRGVGRIPTEPGEAAVSVITGESGQSEFNAVSQDGQRIFFSAARLAGRLSEEVGQTGIFVREDGPATTDISTSQTSTPDLGATYQGANRAGTRVYFTANAGLTADSSATGTDLYEYDFTAPEGERLSDLTAVPGGDAEVAGVAGFAENGTHVYFATQIQMVPGQGKSTAENEAAEGYSLYDASGGALAYVGALKGRHDLFAAMLGVPGVSESGPKNRTSRVSSDGRYLLFESSANVTGYSSAGAPMAYLYNASAAEAHTVCVSCVQDGSTSQNAPNPTPSHRMATGEQASNPLYSPDALIDPAGEATIFFTSKDALAASAVSGDFNLYEWAHGQVFLVAGEPHGASSNSSDEQIQFAGASADGTDLYFFDAKALNWENPQGRSAAWDARIGGGFPESAPPSTPCDANVEGACQGPAADAPSQPNAATPSFSGPGNLKPKASKPKHHHKKKKHKRKGRNGKATKGGKGKRSTKGDGRQGR